MNRRPRQRTPRGRTLVGERYEVVAGPVAHGGHVVARHEGRVLFVRHALTGERVTVEVTEGEEDSR
ncbi:MAG TPA: TRAM domain-containing protein, partial [Candidatus Limnocylindria bacterium]|nr:TRAM domain-containing protein [Candidatus Limnocylindria bacterium]